MGGADCDEHICSSEKDQQQRDQVLASNNSIKSNQKADRLPRSEGPLTKDQIGNATWPILHKLSLSYPENPNPEQKQRIIKFINGFAWMYPCKVCAADLREKIVEHPPKVESREELAMWFCLQHNLVNQKLMKPEFKCSMRRLELTYGRKSFR